MTVGVLTLLGSALLVKVMSCSSSENWRSVFSSEWDVCGGAKRSRALSEDPAGVFCVVDTSLSAWDVLVRPDRRFHVEAADVSCW